MADIGVNTDQRLVRIDGQCGGVSFSNMGSSGYTVKEVLLNESILNPGLQTLVTLHSYIYMPGKDLDSFKGGQLSLSLANKDGDNLSVAQKIYRLDNRDFNPSNVGATEEFTLHACDQSLLSDAKSLVSKSWKCETPDKIVKYVLQSCAGVRNLEVDSASPARDYIAENIHPFQVVVQQANVALDGDDPSFVHFMTYKNNGTHHFKSLKKLCKGSVSGSNQFYYNDGGGESKYSYNANKQAAITFMFPCDFDLLSDILNGVDESGQNINSLTTVNPLNMAMQLFGMGGGGGSGGGLMSGSCGVGSGNAKQSVTNKGTAKDQGGCETDVEKHLLKRQARMGLLEKDKIALRMTTAWRPDIHVGDLVGLNCQNNRNSRNGAGGCVVYGSGTYLVTALTHKIMHGGFATTTMDCVAQTAGGGIV